MRAFCKEIIITFTAICLLLLGLEIFVDYHPNDFSTKYNYWYENRDKITTLLIGNSHIQANVRADLIGDSSYNMAIGGSSIQHALSIASSYIPQMENLKTVIINFDYINLYDSTGNLYNRKNCTKNKRNSNWENYMNYIHYRYLHAGISFTRFDHAISCNQLHYSTLINNNLTDLNLYKLDETFHDTPNFSIGPVSMEQYNNCVSSIAKIAKIVSDNNAKLIVITSPAHHTFRSQTNTNNIELMNSTMDSLSQVYPIRYKNYLLDTTFYHEEMFADIHHLNRAGANTFARRIKKDFNL